MRRIVASFATLILVAGVVIGVWAVMASVVSEPAAAQPDSPASTPFPVAANQPGANKPAGTQPGQFAPMASDDKVQPAPDWDFDPAHCSILFTVKHIFVKIPGRFSKYAGTVRFDPDNLAGSKIDVSVDMASVDTFVPKRDEDLRSPHFFDVAKYPVMAFESQRIVHRKGNQYVAVGDLTIKDITRRIELPFTYYGEKTSPLDPVKQVAGFESHFTVNLLDYHVGDGHFQAMGALGSKADVTLYLELVR